VFTAGPFVWILLASLEGPQAIFRSRIGLSGLSLANYRAAFTAIDVGRYLLNTVIVSVGSTLIAVTLGVLAGYGLARFRIIGDRWLLLAIVATQLFPGLLLTIPLYLILRDFHLIDSLLGLILVYTVFSLPFAVWMMRNYFRSIPAELTDAGLIDGCSQLGVLRRVVLPVSVPGIIACSAFCLIIAWDDFLYASTFLISNSHFTISVGLYSLMSQYGTNWGVLLAGTVLATLPVVAAFLAVPGRLTNLVSGGIKG
jgi:ABC-type glycerol-3-phosphate transport system permease component